MIAALDAPRLFIAHGWRRAWHERIAWSVQVAQYGLLIFIFAALFAITPFADVAPSWDLNAETMIWYVIATELAIFTGGLRHFHDMRNDILRGKFAVSLSQPRSYFGLKLWFWLGNNSLNLLIFLLAGVVLGVMFTDTFPYGYGQIFFLIISTFLASLIFGASYFSLAALEVWGPFSRPGLWIFQKCAFLLGGLFVPLHLYPAWLQELAWLTPYPAMLNIPGRIVFAPTFTEMLAGLLLQLFWLTVITALGFVMQHRAYNRMLKG